MVFSIFRTMCVVAFVTMAACSLCYSSDVVFLNKPGAQSSSDQIQIATHFYGLTVAEYFLRDKSGVAGALQAIHQGATLAAVVDADALLTLNRHQLLAALRRANAKNIPLMVINIKENTPPEALTTWSGGAILGCEGVLKAADHYKVGTLQGFTNELSGQDLVAQPGRSCALLLNGAKAQSVLALSSTGGSIYSRAEDANQEVFFATGIEHPTAPLKPFAYDVPDYQFSAVAPFMMFFRYAAGGRAWHSNRQFANVTIDDPLLQEPYGYVNYSNLLLEMEKHKFHTTIAFIPWNFDRSQPQVVSLFRNHPDLFSICIHGNNHDHQEFPSLQNRSLEVQTANLKQALARMERFHQLTQLPYDRVMVFPHSIGPTETLVALKRYNYLATVNSQDVPLDSSYPQDPTFALRPMTLAFYSFPSLRRYSAEIPIPESTLAVDAFLGNPLLFYVHQSYFAEGENRFDPIADTVNRLVPDVRWRGLGDIAEHLYLEKLRLDGNYDIKAFASSIQLENIHSKDAVFFVAKDEDFRIPLKVLVDGKPYPYTKNADLISFQVPVRAGMSRQVTIQYQNNLDLSTVDLSRSSLRVAALRYLSEFRDNVVSRSSLGQKLTQIYTRDETSLNRDIVIGLAVLIIAVAAFIWRTRKGTQEA